MFILIKSYLKYNKELFSNSIYWYYITYRIKNNTSSNEDSSAGGEASADYIIAQAKNKEAGKEGSTKTTETKTQQVLGEN